MLGLTKWSTTTFLNLPCTCMANFYDLWYMSCLPLWPLELKLNIFLRTKGSLQQKKFYVCQTLLTPPPLVTNNKIYFFPLFLGPMKTVSGWLNNKKKFKTPLYSPEKTSTTSALAPKGIISGWFLADSWLTFGWSLSDAWLTLGSWLTDYWLTS